MNSLFLAVCYLLGYSSVDGTAICFGTKEEGAIIPATLERRQSDDSNAMKGVKTLVLEEWIENVADSAFENSSDLETVVIRRGVTRLGSRAFANCPKLTGVVFESDRTIDAMLDTFVGAATNLTAVYIRQYGGAKSEILRPKMVWFAMTAVDRSVGNTISLRATEKGIECRYIGPRVSGGGFIYSILPDGRSARLIRLTQAGNVLELPSEIEGFPVSTSTYDMIPENSQAKALHIGRGFLRDSDRGRWNRKFDVVLAECYGESWYWDVSDILSENGRFYYKEGSHRNRYRRNDELGNRLCRVPSWVTMETLLACPNGQIPMENGWRYLVRQNGEAVLIGYEENKVKNAVTIPSKLGGFTVVGLMEGLFSGAEEMTELTIPNSVTEIPEGLCYGCPQLKTVRLPQKLKSIGRCAFLDCPKLESPTLGKDVRVGDWAFGFLSQVIGGTIKLTPPRNDEW